MRLFCDHASEWLYYSFGWKNLHQEMEALPDTSERSIKKLAKKLIRIAKEDCHTKIEYEEMFEIIDFLISLAEQNGKI